MRLVANPTVAPTSQVEGVPDPPQPLPGIAVPVSTQAQPTESVPAGSPMWKLTPSASSE